MRKYSFPILLTTLVLSILAGCTLTLEEYTTPEEDMGFDEPVTVENEYGSFTYQYNEGVRAITPNIQDYIVRVEDDSILFFRDDTPRKWLPSKGDLLAAGCSRKLPKGLNHRVLQVDKFGDEYRVAVTMATRNEVYKTCEINIDLDYEAPNLPVYDSLYLDSLGIDIDDLEVTDFSYLDAANSDSTQEQRYARTRADKNVDTVTINRSVDFSIGNYVKASLGVTHTVKQTIHYEESKEKNTRHQYTIDYSETTIDVTASVGKTLGKDIKASTSPNDPKLWNELLKDINKIEDKAKKKQERKVTIAKLTTPVLSPVPVTLVFDFSANLTIEGAIFGGAKVTFHHAKTKSGCKYEGKKKIPIPTEVIKEGHMSFDQLNFGGQLTATMGFRAGAGFEIPGIGIGTTLGMSLVAGAEFKFDVEYTGSDLIVDHEQSYLKAFVDFKVDVQVYFSPLGIKVADATTDLYNKRILEATTHFNPLINAKKTGGTYKVVTKPVTIGGIETSIRQLKYTNTINFEKLYTITNRWHKEYTHPRLRVYHGDNYNGKYIELKTTGGSALSGELTAEPNVTYTYEFTQDDLLSEEANYTCVPCLYDALSKTTTEFREHVKTYGKQTPKITFKKYSQITGLSIYDALDGDLDYINDLYGDWLSGSNPKNSYLYSFWFSFNFANTGFIDKWGISAEVLKDPHTSNKLFSTETEIASGSYIGAGKKTIICEFVSTFKNEDKYQCMQVRVRPYTINLLGERKDYSWTKWQNIKFPCDNPQEIDGESFSVFF